MSPESGISKVKNLSVGPCEFSPVHLGANCQFDLKGRCSKEPSDLSRFFRHGSCLPCSQFSRVLLSAPWIFRHFDRGHFQVEPALLDLVAKVPGTADS